MGLLVLLRDIMLIEFITLSTLYGSIYLVYIFRKLILSDLKIKTETNIYANNEEEIYETGFLQDMEIYDNRIDDLKETLKQTKGNSPFIPSDINPPIEIITDVYEMSMEERNERRSI